MENQDVPEDSLNHEYDFLGGKANINCEENVCMKLKEMGVLEINPEELRIWKTHGFEDEDDVRMKPGVDDNMYENGRRRTRKM